MRAMKDSGDQFIGNIPLDWRIGRTKQLTDISIGLVTTMTSNYVESEKDGVPLIRNSNIRMNYIDSSKMVFLSREFAEKNTSRALKVGDIVTVHTGDVGTSAIITEKYGMSQGFATINSRIKQEEIITKEFLCWFYNSEAIKGMSVAYSTGDGRQNLNLYDFIDFHVAIPSVCEQREIVNFLDRKCSRIDSIIAKEQEVIAKLQEYKLSLITEKVTKGLNPNVEMKDSGIEWIGEIPKAWLLTHIGNLGEIGSGGTPDRKKEEYWNGDIPWMSSGEINNEYIYDTYEKITIDGIVNSNAKLLPVNTVMLGLIGQGKTKGLTAILKIEAACNQNLAYIKPKKEVLYYQYLFYCFKAMYFYIRGLVGDSQAGIYVNFLKKRHIPLPPMAEQQAIVSYLDTKCAAIDAAIAKKQALIEKFTEYKKSLIYEVVTGKKEV